MLALCTSGSRPLCGNTYTRVFPLSSHWDITKCFVELRLIFYPSFFHFVFSLAFFFLNFVNLIFVVVFYTKTLRLTLKEEQEFELGLLLSVLLLSLYFLIHKLKWLKITSTSVDHVLILWLAQCINNFTDDVGPCWSLLGFSLLLWLTWEPLKGL